MIYASVCSGIEAATVAWEPLGWKAAWFAEIEKFPSAVLAHHWPDVENKGDFTKINEPAGSVQLLAGGTPCQSFSVAGGRAGLDDPRGNLTLEFVRLARRLRPAWVVWENVPGVLSIDGGRTFGGFLHALEECGYGWAYRVLDAQYFGVPQRRRRVFVVGHLGGWAGPSAVLFEPESMSGNPPPRREAGERIAQNAQNRLASGGEVTGPVLANYGEKWGLGDQEAFRGEHHIVPALSGSGAGTERTGNERTEAEMIVTGTLPADYGKQGGNTFGETEGSMIPPITHSLTARHNSSEDGTGRGTPIVPILEAGARQDKKGDPRDGIIAFAQNTRDEVRQIGGDGQTAGALGADVGMKQQTYLAQGIDGGETGYSLRANPSHSGDKGDGGVNTNLVTSSMTVRRLTPVECEFLMDFPRNYTLIPWRGKPAELCPDGPRYRALGNSMVVNVMRWIGERIETVEGILK